jgi:N-acyl-D-amino-acid deacylase
VLNIVNMTWETVGEYMDTLDKRLGVNVGNLIGHSAVRYYVMGDECQGRAATPDEIEAMRGIVREGMHAGALGLSVSKNRGHYAPRASIFRRSGRKKTRSLRSRMS